MNDSNLVWRVTVQHGHGCHCLGTRLAGHALIRDLVRLARVDQANGWTRIRELHP